MATTDEVRVRKLFTPDPAVAAILANHPPGWIGTTHRNGQSIAMCLKEAWVNPPSAQVPMKGIGGHVHSDDPFYFFVDDQSPASLA